MAGSVRLLTEEDAPAFLTLRVRMLREHPGSFHSSPEEWEGALDRAAERIRGNPVVGAFVGGALVGCAVLAREARPGAKLRHKAEIWGVYLAPEHRGAGLAEAMVERVVEEARALGYEALVLSVTTGNPARRLYERLGFQAWGVEPRAVRLPSGEYLDDCYMQLDLS